MRFFASYLGEAEGRLEVVEMDIDKTPMHMLPTGVDIVECVNFQHRYDEREIAQTLLYFGNTKSRHLFSLFGGFGNEDKLATVLEREARSIGRKVEVVQGLFTSTTYPDHRGVLLRIY